MSNDFRDLAVGDWVTLTGESWGENRHRTVTIDRIVTEADNREYRQAWNDSVVGVGSLTTWNGFAWGDDFAIERVAQHVTAALTPPDKPVELTAPAQPTTQGYTLSLYVSKTAAAEFPGETQELASITINHDDLASLLSQGRGILDVVADG
ncbi:hypothetical protein SEA_TUKTUK_65 [Microbacterium phage TukTuk]